MEYLGFGETHDWVRTLDKKEAMENMTPPTIQKGVHAFISLANYYRDIWERCSHTLETLTNLNSNTVIFKWNKPEQKYFEEIDQIVDHNNLLIYPYFNKWFEINTDDREFQLGEVIIQ